MGPQGKGGAGSISASRPWCVFTAISLTATFGGLLLLGNCREQEQQELLRYSVLALSMWYSLHGTIYMGPYSVHLLYSDAHVYNLGVLFGSCCRILTMFPSSASGRCGGQMLDANCRAIQAGQSSKVVTSNFAANCNSDGPLCKSQELFGVSVDPRWKLGWERFVKQLKWAQSLTSAVVKAMAMESFGMVLI